MKKKYTSNTIKMTLSDTIKNYFIDTYNYNYFGGDYTNYQFDNLLFIQQRIGSDNELLLVDFDESNPIMQLINLYTNSGSLPRHFIAFGGYLFLTAKTPSLGQVIWYYNPVLQEFNYNVINNQTSGTMGFADDDPFYLFDDRLFFYKHEIIINADGTPEVIDNALCVDGQSLTREMVKIDSFEKTLPYISN